MAANGLAVRLYLIKKLLADMETRQQFVRQLQFEIELIGRGKTEQEIQFIVLEMARIDTLLKEKV